MDKVEVVARHELDVHAVPCTSSVWGPSDLAGLAGGVDYSACCVCYFGTQISSATRFTDRAEEWAVD